MGKVRELRSAALVEINFTVCFKMFTGSWTVAFRDCHKVLREVVAKGLPSFQSEKWGPLGYLYYGWVIQKWGYDSGFWIVVYAWNNTSDCVTLIHIRDNQAAGIGNMTKYGTIRTFYWKPMKRNGRNLICQSLLVSGMKHFWLQFLKHPDSQGIIIVRSRSNECMD